MRSVAPDTNRLVESHRSYAHAIAADILRNLPPSIDKRELESAAELGLVEAASAFDPSRGVQFKTFSYYRIRGAVYDSLRKLGWFTNAPRKEAQFEEAANEYLKDYTVASPPPASAEDSYREIQNVAGSIVASYILSLDGMPQEPADSRNISPEERAAQEQRSERLRAAVRGLPEKNRKVIEGYYFKNLSLEQIGEQLGLSKSWVCRVHAKSLELVRQALAEQSRPAPATREATSRLAAR